MPKIRVAPTTHPAEISGDDINKFIETALQQNVDEIHFDVMDGIYTPHAAMSIKQAKLARKQFKAANFSVHIMVANPKKYVKQYLKIAPRVIFFQVEGAKNLNEAEKLLALSTKTTQIGLAIDLKTELSTELLALINKTPAALIMTVQTGKSGQKMSEEALKKVEQIKQTCQNIKEIYVDGGINNTNYKKVIAAGATTLCLGSYMHNLIKNNAAGEFVKKINL